MSPAESPRVAAPQQAARDLFWRRHAKLGVALSMASIAILVAYITVGANGQQRSGLLALAAVATVFTAAVGLAAPRVIGRRWDHAFFLVWSLGVVAVILAGAAIDGGDESPITVTLFLPLLFGALAYGPRPVFSLGMVELAGYLALVWDEAVPSSARTTVFGATLVLATMMATRAARNREGMTRQLRDLTAMLEAQALRDPLTGCLNRRGFDDAVEAEVARAVRYQRPVSLLLVDVDRLKEVNDERGHDAGDRALVRVAAALATVSRRTDVTARLGGDEFAVLAPETRIGDATGLADRLHASLLERTDDLPVTVSVGVASLERDVADVAELLRRADVALYDAKRGGRDRTAVFGRPPGRRRRPTSARDGAEAVATRG